LSFNGYDSGAAGIIERALSTGMCEGCGGERAAPVIPYPRFEKFGAEQQGEI